VFLDVAIRVTGSAHGNVWRHRLAERFRGSYAIRVSPGSFVGSRVDDTNVRLAPNPFDGPFVRVLGTVHRLPTGFPDPVVSSAPFRVLTLRPHGVLVLRARFLLASAASSAG